MPATAEPPAFHRMRAAILARIKRQSKNADRRGTQVIIAGTKSQEREKLTVEPKKISPQRKMS